MKKLNGMEKVVAIFTGAALALSLCGCGAKKNTYSFYVNDESPLSVQDAEIKDDVFTITTHSGNVYEISREQLDHALENIPDNEYVIECFHYVGIDMNIYISPSCNDGYVGSFDHANSGTCSNDPVLVKRNKKM